MSDFENQYLDLLEEIIDNGSLEKNRTGISAYTIPSAIIKHDMKNGFPLLTTRKLPYKSTKVELEGFIKGISSKKWYRDRGCKYWNDWANPQKVEYGNDAESKDKMMEEDDLGIIYGNNWRDFHCPVSRQHGGYTEDSPVGLGVDQLENIVNTLKNNPQDRRMLCLSWNPLALDYAALPACHFAWRVMVIGGKLHLSWFQRSVDFLLGLPANFSSYATLLHLLAKESGLQEGTLTGHLDCVHVYENHIEGARLQLDRETKKLPTIKTDRFTSIFNWEHNDTELLNYQYGEPIKFEVAV